MEGAIKGCTGAALKTGCRTCVIRAERLIRVQGELGTDDGFSELHTIALWLPSSFIVASTIIVFIHERGHFLVAPGCGVAVEVFQSASVAKSIAGKTGRYPLANLLVTSWRLCKFEGDANAKSLPQALSDAATARSQAISMENLFGSAPPLWPQAPLPTSYSQL